MVDTLVEGIAAQDRQGQERLCRAAVIDITRQKHANEVAAANKALQSEIAAHQRAEEALRSLAQFPDKNPYPVLRIERAGTVLYANGASAALGGPWRCEVGCPASEPLVRLVRETLDSGTADLAAPWATKCGARPVGVGDGARTFDVEHGIRILVGSC